MTCDCATRPRVLYWLKDAIWKEAQEKAGRNLGVSCVRCIEQAIERPLTLHDLDVAGYRKTIKKENPEAFMQAYTRATIIGACRVAGVATPDGWVESTEPPHPDGFLVGDHLARQTPDATAVVSALIAEVNQSFPG